MAEIGPSIDILRRDAWNKRINHVWLLSLYLLCLSWIPFLIALLFPKDSAAQMICLTIAGFGWFFGFVSMYIAKFARLRYIARYGWPEDHEPEGW